MPSHGERAFGRVRIMRRVATAATAVVLACGMTWVSASAQDETSLDVTVVEELIARPLTPGPAWWRVADADSAVWIMTEPFTTPRGLAWDRTVLERRMEGANQYISPFDLSLLDPRSIVGMGGALLNAPRLLLAPRPKREPRPTAPLEETLPPEVRARFVALREKLGHPAERYAGMTPIEASRKITQDYQQRHPLGEMDVYVQVEETAKRHKVRVVPAYRVKIPATGYKVEVERIDPADGPACLDRAVVSLERNFVRTRRAAEAWAQGNVRPLLSAGGMFVIDEGPELNCFNGGSISVDPKGPLAGRLDEEFVASQAAVIERALRTPGRSVALLPLTSPFGNVEMGLVGRRGVLERLRARGYEITSPAGL